MKKQRAPKFSKRPTPANPLKIADAEYPTKKEILESVSLVMSVQPVSRIGKERESSDSIQLELKTVASIATNAWKARCKMVDEQSGEPRDEMKRVFRHIDAVLKTFHEIGLEVKGHTGDVFDYGLPLKVITTQPTPGISKERVTETIKPTIKWQNKIIQMGEVVIATPA